MKNKEKSLAKNTIIILMSKFFTQFLSLLMLPLLTKALSTGEYGSFDLITTYAWLAAGFMSFQVENGIFRFLIDSRSDEEKSSNIIFNGLVTIVLLFVIFTIIYIPIFSLLRVNNYLYIYFYAISTLMFNIPLQTSRGLGDNKTFSIASVISGTLNIIFSFISLYIFKIGLLGLVLSYSIANIIGGTYIVIKKAIVKYIVKQKIRKKEMKEIFKYSVPLLLNSISSWIMNISDKAMISFLISNSATGIYSVSTKFPILLSHFYGVFNLSWSESASMNVNESDKDDFFSKVINKVFFICSSICLLVMAVMPLIFIIMIDNKFSDSYFYVPILILASIFELFSVLLGGIYISFKLSKRIAISTFIASIFNVLINLIFLKTYGIVVACFSTLISYIILSFIRYFEVKKYVKLSFEKKNIILVLAIFAIMLPLYYNKTIINSILLLIISTITAFLLNKNVIVSYLAQIKNYFKQKINHK